LKEFQIRFPSQTFGHYWKFVDLGGDRWGVEAFWSLDKQNKIEVNKNLFESEILRLIDTIESDLKNQGYEIFGFIEYQNVRKNVDDEILAWRKYPDPLGSYYYNHSLEKEFYVKVLFEFCKKMEAKIFPAGWKFLMLNYGLKGLYKIDKVNCWFDVSSTKVWLESILYHGLISGINLETLNYGDYSEESKLFKCDNGMVEMINWEKFKSQDLS